MIDVSQQINAVSRKVGTRVLEAGEARTVTISQTYDAAIEDVWDACTNPGRIPRWFLPISGDLRVGGRYQLEGNANGTIERCDPPKSFAATWEYGGEISWIEVRFEPAPQGGTRLEIEHIAHADERWAEFGPGAVGVGWDMGLIGLTIHLSAGKGPDAAGKAVDPQEVAAWAASEDGRRFMSLSSGRWGEANIAAGADEEGARAAAQRTTNAYTGQGPDAGTAADAGTPGPEAPGSGSGEGRS